MVDLPQSRNLRTSDLAKEVDVHPNTVRLYEEWGYLPPIPRSDTGYRQFSFLHLAQMNLARLAFSDPFPGRHVRRSLADLVRLAALADFSVALRAAYAHQDLVGREIAQTEVAAKYLDSWVAGDMQVEDQARLLSGSTADLLQVTRDTLRHWERNGLITPPRDPHNGYRRYGSQEIGRLHVLRLLTRAGYSTMAVLRMVHFLEQGRRVNLSELLESPAEDEDVIYAADRWLSTLRTHEERASQIIIYLRDMMTQAGSSRGI